MARTTDELAISVLKKLGRLPDGQVAPASQREQIKDEYEDLYQELLDDGIVNWSSTDSIPNNMFSPIKRMLLDRVADNFGVPNKWAYFPEASGIPTERAMRKKILGLLSSPYTPQTTPFRNY